MFFIRNQNQIKRNYVLLFENTIVSDLRYFSLLPSILSHYQCLLVLLRFFYIRLSNFIIRTNMKKNIKFIRYAFKILIFKDIDVLVNKIIMVLNVNFIEVKFLQASFLVIKNFLMVLFVLFLVDSSYRDYKIWGFSILSLLPFFSLLTLFILCICCCRRRLGN